MRNKGFTLVELLVAALLMVLLVAGALALVARGRAAYRSAESRARVEETARAALDLLAFELRMAGYLGPLAPGSAVQGSTAVGEPAPLGLGVGGGCVDSLALDLATPLAGADGRYAATPARALGCRASPSGRTVPGSDTLVLRRASAWPAAPDAGRLQLEATRRTGRLMADGLRRFGEKARLHDLEANVYYVSADSTGERGRPSLRRKRLLGGESPVFRDEELVPGIADLQVEAGVDLDLDGATDTYVTLDEIAPGVRVRSARLWVLAESGLPEAAPSNLPALDYANRALDAAVTRFPRLVASRTVELRNVGGAP